MKKLEKGKIKRKRYIRRTREQKRRHEGERRESYIFRKINKTTSKTMQ